jgi:hypothetical protein
MYAHSLHRSPAQRLRHEKEEQGTQHAVISSGHYPEDVALVLWKAGKDARILNCQTFAKPMGQAGPEHQVEQQ